MPLDDLGQVQTDVQIINSKMDLFQSEVEQNSVTHARIFERLEVLERGQGQNTLRFDTIMTMLGEMKEDLKSLKDKPAKRWDTAVSSIITLLISVIGGMILGKFIL